MFLSDSGLLLVTLSDSVQPWATLEWRCTTLSDSEWLWVTPGDSEWLYMTLSDLDLGKAVISWKFFTYINLKKLSFAISFQLYPKRQFGNFAICGWFFTHTLYVYLEQFSLSFLYPWEIIYWVIWAKEELHEVACKLFYISDPGLVWFGKVASQQNPPGNWRSFYWTLSLFEQQYDHS